MYFLLLFFFVLLAFINRELPTIDVVFPNFTYAIYMFIYFFLVAIDPLLLIRIDFVIVQYFHNFDPLTFCVV